MVIKTNLSSIAALTQKGNYALPTSTSPIGKVYAVITTPNTPTEKLYKENGGSKGIGTIFYRDFNETTSQEDSFDPNTVYKSALPLSPGNQDYPLVGELVLIIDGPSPSSQFSSANNQKYYISVVNLWNNVQISSPTGNEGSKTFEVDPNVKSLQPFEGDRIYQGRKGSGIRFGSTVSLFSNLNNWSSVGKNGSPITLLVNGYSSSDSNLSIEDINKDNSSIYLTSTQRIPLQPGAIIKNPFNSSVIPNNYFSSQIMLNSNRIVLNSKENDILLFSKSNIELNTDTIINLNAGEIIHLHLDEKKSDNKILLGTKNNGDVPTEPVLLGLQTQDTLLKMCNALIVLADFLESVVVPTTEGGILVTGCNNAGTQLRGEIENIMKNLPKIQSTKVYTI